MRKTTTILGVLFAAACGGTDDDGVEMLDGFEPDAPLAGEVQIITPIVRGVAPGADVTLCTYLPRDVQLGAVDVIGAKGFQSANGAHHAILYQAVSERPIDTHECTDDDMANSIPLAITGGEATSTSAVPEGLAFRSEANKQLFVQTHWINTTEAVLDGQAAFNLKVQPVSEAIQPASLFTIVDTDITIPAGGTGNEGTRCTFAEDISFATLGGHAHEWGTRVRLYFQPSGDAPEEMIYDHPWDHTKTFDPPTLRYTKDAPYVVPAGASIRVECDYLNDTERALRFPSEMCVGFGFYFPGTAQRDCVNGNFPE